MFLDTFFYASSRKAPLAMRGLMVVILVGSAFALSPVPEWVELPLTLLEDEKLRAASVGPSPRASPQSLPYLAEQALSRIAYYQLGFLSMPSPSPEPSVYADMGIDESWVVPLEDDGSNNRGGNDHTWLGRVEPRLGAYSYDDYGEEVPEEGEKGWMSMHLLEWF